MFRALKTKGKTPKYGLIFNSTFIGRAGQKNKGRISRYLANKCAIAARLDSFSENPTNKFGETLKEQMEERLKFLSTGEKPRKNVVAMKEVLDELKEEGLYYAVTAGKDGKKKKDKKSKKVVDTDDEEEEKPKKKKDKKKRKERETSDDEEIEEEKPKMKKKKTK